eukprot:TRINITY_DN10838_c0_g1_i1.p1 TRINITY_DN10838_c0_g1~~TRINITY_DN10838_c0_g1_i1.p1  ORF type:complete len:285 (+),score=51.72 TRINITY_DN10838_c0_g1_i1:55-909(+)
MNPNMAQRLGIQGVRNIIAVSSCKGGVGKSTTAVNLAVAMSNLGKVTGLLDADLQGPSVPKMLGMDKLQGVKGTAEGKMIPPQNYGVKAISLGLLVDEDKSVVARGPMISQQVQGLIQQVDWGDLDILCIDMPPGTHDVHLTIAQHLSLDGAVIVTTPQEIATMDTRRGMTMFREVKVPLLGLVENMSYFICPNCTEKHYLFGEEDTARKAADKFGIPFLGSIPFEMANRQSSDLGTPVTHLGEKGHRLAQPYYNIAREILKILDRKNQEGKGGSGKLEIVFED